MDRKSSQAISKKQKGEVAQLRRITQKRLLKIAVPVIALLSIISLVQSPDYSKRESYGSQKIRELDESAIRYLEWLKVRGTSSEILLFNSLSQSLHDAALEVESSAERNKAAQIYLAILQGLQRVAFLAIAGIRLWIVLFICGVIYGMRVLKPYAVRDLLGVTGNGRLFYSGIFADLSQLSKDGVPSMLVPGLACPQSKSPQEVISSTFGALLKQYNALNKTTTTLCGIILAYPELPAYAGQSDDPQIQNTFAGATLIDCAYAMLKEALSIHGSLSSEKKSTTLGTTSPVVEKSPGQKITLLEHAALLREGFSSVLPESLAKAICDVDVYSVAALVLSLEAGKVLAFGREGNRWVKKSQHPQLCARAVLHSIPTFSEEYSFESRKVIRQAMIYGSRFSVFGPVRLPLQLSPETRSLRQWAELLLAAPHELNSVVHEVEFYGYASELHAKWQKFFFDGIVSHNASVVDGAVSSDTGLLFMPIERVVSLIRSISSEHVLKRLDELVKILSQLQRIHTMSLDLGSDPLQGEGIKGPLPQYQKIFTPLSQQELKSLADFNEVKFEVLRDWSTIRNVFNAYGWLARQVGSSSIADHSCVSAVFKGIEASLGGNARNLLGRRGMIPFRGSYLEQKLGKFWKTRFLQSSAVVIADDAVVYEKLLSGAELSEDEESNVGIS